MTIFHLSGKSLLNRESVFSISTDVKNFHNIMPNYFKSLDILSEDESGIVVLEKINFLGQSVNVKTKHLVLPPNVHKVFILTGPLKGTSFIEYYEESSSGTLILISVNLKINGLLKFIPFIENILRKKMSPVMLEFINCAEKYYIENKLPMS
ncbi:MAG: hypothetical protein ACW9XH_06095 [Candidatus Nitrosopumilus sp. bin_32a]|jgi:hypothetical protein